jgi:predicted MPP superfamily phosphohydrolase
VKRLALIVLLICTATALIAGAHLYIARRLVLDPGMPQPWRGLALGLIVAAGVSLVLQPFGERLLRPARARWIAWPASLWMGLAFYLLILLGASDLLLLLSGGTAVAAQGAAAEPSAGMRAFAVSLVALSVCGIGLRSALRPPRLERVEVELSRWPAGLDGFRIVQISDIHIGPILGRDFAAHLTERVNALAPDLVAVTGDLVDGAVSKLSDEVAPFAELRGREGVFFVTGNHDHYSGARAWAARASELGMRVLRNERVEIRRGDDVFDLVGVDDHRGHHLDPSEREDLDRALEGRDEARAAILLAHDPSTFRRARSRSVDLQISGHTHGGQVWPFRYLVRAVTPYVAGLYREGEAQVYVSRGAGFWGPPMRLLAPAEITEIVIRRSGSIQGSASLTGTADDRSSS